MRRALLLLAFITTTQAQSLTQYYAENFTTSGLNAGAWHPINGALWATASGLTHPAHGSIISSLAVPDGTSEYEVRTTYKLLQSGGSYITYLRATSDASLYANTGTFFAVEVKDVVVNGSSCTANVVFWKRQNGTSSPLSTQPIDCQNTLELRSIMRNGHIYVVRGGAWGHPLVGYHDITIPSGRPGVGVSGAPAANGIPSIILLTADRQAPSQPGIPGVTALSNRIDMQWAGSVEPPNGSGIYVYSIFRKGPGDANWVFRAYPRSPSFTDEAVLPSTTYQYLIEAGDYHLNYSTARIITVQTAPAGSTDVRQIGMRPTGSYWGAGPEQIDMQSGNLNLTIPVAQAKSRSGWGATFALNHNSQCWRKDSGGEWTFCRDTGFGYGWRLLAGSIRPVYETYMTIDHYVFSDSTGAEYRLDRTHTGLWTSAESIHVAYDPATRRLRFNDGSFWVMDAESNEAEGDAGTLYPTLMQDSNGNQIKMTYGAGAFASWQPNSSSRLTAIYDVRSLSPTVPSFSLGYNGTGRLLSVNGPGANFALA